MPIKIELYYYNARWQILTTTDGAGNNARNYIYGNYIDEVLVGMWPNGSSNGLVQYYAHNHLFSLVAVLNSDGSVYSRYEYDAYGKPHRLNADFTAATGIDFYKITLAFTGRRIDVLDNGSLTLQYNRNRYYDYNTGRWLTQDPLGVVPGGYIGNFFYPSMQYNYSINIYEYCQGTPSLSVDEYGLLSKIKKVNKIRPHRHKIPIQLDDTRRFQDPLFHDGKNIFAGIEHMKDAVSGMADSVQDGKLIYQMLNGCTPEDKKKAANDLLEKYGEKGLEKILTGLLKRAGYSSGVGMAVSLMIDGAETGNALGNYIAGKIADTVNAQSCNMCKGEFLSKNEPGDQKVILKRSASGYTVTCWKIGNYVYATKTVFVNQGIFATFYNVICGKQRPKQQKIMSCGKVCG